MTGPEHYRRAEALLATSHYNSETDPDLGIVEYYPAVEDAGDDGNPVNTVGNALLAAQVHATLALAAATAAAQATAYDGDETHQRSRGWAGVA